MIWEQIFKSREWGKYPPEDLVRIATRYVRESTKKRLSCLEIGPGPGANAILLSDLFSKYAAIDISATAIKLLDKRIAEKQIVKELKVGCISTLPWEDNCFDFVCDNFSIYANRIEVIHSCLLEIKRIMKNNAIFYSRVWGNNCYGLDSGICIEKNTYKELSSGPCSGYGTSHFFDLNEIKDTYGFHFNIKSIRKINSCFIFEDGRNENKIEEFIIISELK